MWSEMVLGTLRVSRILAGRTAREQPFSVERLSNQRDGRGCAGRTLRVWHHPQRGALGCGLRPTGRSESLLLHVCRWVGRLRSTLVRRRRVGVHWCASVLEPPERRSYEKDAWHLRRRLLSCWDDRALQLGEPAVSRHRPEEQRGCARAGARTNKGLPPPGRLTFPIWNAPPSRRAPSPSPRGGERGRPI